MRVLIQDCSRLSACPSELKCVELEAHCVELEAHCSHLTGDHSCERLTREETLRALDLLHRFTGRTWNYDATAASRAREVSRL